MKNLKDEAKARGYLEKMAEQSSSVGDLAKLATTVKEVLGDDDWTRKLLQDAQAACDDRFGLLTIAGKAASSLGDQKMAGEIYAKAAELCSRGYQFEHVFSYVEQQGGGQEILKKLYDMAEAKLSSAKELAALAESVMRRFGSEDWARTLYKKAAEAAI